MSSQYQDRVYEDAIICHFNSDYGDPDLKAKSDNDNNRVASIRTDTNIGGHNGKRRKSLTLEDVDLDLVRHTVNNHNFKDTYFDKDTTLQYCNTALDLLSDIRSLCEGIANSEDFQRLSKKVDDIFLHSTASTLNSTKAKTKTTAAVSDDTVRDLAIQSIQEVNKLLISFEVCSQETSVIREHLSRNIAFVIQDSLTLLLQLWFLLMKSLKTLRFRVMTLFIKAKCLVINYELSLILKYLDDSLLMQENGGSDLASGINVKSRDSVQHILDSFNSFIRALVQDLVMAESQRNQNLFDRCLDIFLDIESMYNQMNFNWLVQEEDYGLQGTGSLEGPSEQSEGSLKEDLYSSRQELDIHNTSPSTSPNTTTTTTATTTSKDADTGTDLEITSSKDLYNNDTASDSDSTMVERSLSISNDPALSQISLTRELPYLLSAFHNAKRLENQLEVARSGANHRTGQATLSSPASASSLTLSPQVFHSPLRDTERCNSVSSLSFSPLTVPPSAKNMNQTGTNDHMQPPPTNLGSSLGHFSTSSPHLNAQSAVTNSDTSNADNLPRVSSSGPNMSAFMNSDYFMSGMNKFFMMNGRSSNLSSALNEASHAVSPGGSSFVNFGGIGGGVASGFGFMGPRSPGFNNPILNNLYGIRRFNSGPSKS